MIGFWGGGGKARQNWPWKSRRVMLAMVMTEWSKVFNTARRATDSWCVRHLTGSGICYPQALQARLDGCMRSQNIRTATLVNKD